MATAQRWVGFLRGLVGGAIGAAVGYFLFGLMLRQGFYALALPAALLGLGCGFASRQASNLLGALCAVAGVALAIFMEWQWRPFNADASLGYFVTHLQDKQGLTQVMIVLSGIFGFWFGRGRSDHAAASEQAQ